VARRSNRRRAYNSPDGSIVDFIFGLLFGFLFGVICVLAIIYTCRISKRLKNGLFFGFVLKVVFAIAF